jgi:hypothetical protein
MFRHQGAIIREFINRRLHQVLDLRNFVVDKLPVDGTLGPKHVAVGIWYEVCFVICFIVF